MMQRSLLVLVKAPQASEEREGVEDEALPAYAVPNYES